MKSLALALMLILSSLCVFAQDQKPTRIQNIREIREKLLKTREQEAEKRFGKDFGPSKTDKKNRAILKKQIQTNNKQLLKLLPDRCPSLSVCLILFSKPESMPS